MPRFFVDEIINNRIIISGDDAVHIGKSLRMKPDEELIASKEGMDYFCKIESITKDTVTCNIISQEKSKNEPSVNITLYQAFPKLDKFEFIIQKSVELGVNKIVPVITSRCISRPDEASFTKKLERLNKIALEASKQCGRAIIPKIENILTLNQAVCNLPLTSLNLVCYEKQGAKLTRELLNSAKNVSLFIGSEGGFSKEEILDLESHNCKSISLGNRILRCETAPIAAISIIMNLTDNM